MIHPKTLGKLYAIGMIFLLKRQSQIPYLSSIARKLAHSTSLLSIWLNAEFKGLSSFHPDIILWSMAEAKKILQEIRHGRHCIFNMHVHLVFVTKYRQGVFTKTILDDMRPIF